MSRISWSPSPLERYVLIKWSLVVFKMFLTFQALHSYKLCSYKQSNVYPKRRRNNETKFYPKIPSHGQNKDYENLWSKKIIVSMNQYNLPLVAQPKQQDKVLNGSRDIKILKIAWSGLKPLITPIISRYEKLLQKFSHALLP